MPAKLEWADEMDVQLLALRGRKVAWNIIAQTMHLSRNTVIERARRIGVVKRSKIGAAVVRRESDDRVPRPAGHPATWGAITHGTCLEGAAYPFPVFDWS